MREIVRLQALTVVKRGYAGRVRHYHLELVYESYAVLWLPFLLYSHDTNLNPGINFFRFSNVSLFAAFQSFPRQITVKNSEFEIW